MYLSIGIVVIGWDHHTTDSVAGALPLATPTVSGGMAAAKDGGTVDEFPNLEECMCGKKFPDESELQLHQVGMLFSCSAAICVIHICYS